MNVHCHYLPMTSVMEGCSRAGVVPFPPGGGGRHEPIKTIFLNPHVLIASECKKLF